LAAADQVKVTRLCVADTVTPVMQASLFTGLTNTAALGEGEGTSFLPLLQEANNTTIANRYKIFLIIV
jgi:hypothetical protein